MAATMDELIQRGKRAASGGVRAIETLTGPSRASLSPIEIESVKRCAREGHALGYRRSSNGALEAYDTRTNGRLFWAWTAIAFGTLYSQAEKIYKEARG